MNLFDAVAADDGSVGVDFLTPMGAALPGAAAATLPQVAVTAGDAQDPGFPDGSFDMITAGLVLFFLPDPAGALRAYRRLLRPALDHHGDPPRGGNHGLRVSGHPPVLIRQNVHPAVQG